MKNEELLLISYLIILQIMHTTSQFLPGMNNMAMNNSKDLELFQKVYNNMQMINSINGLNTNIFQSQTQGNPNFANIDPSQLLILQMLMENNNKNQVSSLGWNNNFKQLGFPKLYSKGDSNINNPIPEFKFSNADLLKNNLPPIPFPIQQEKSSNIEAASAINTIKSIENTKETNVSDQLKKEIKELKELTEEANKVIKPKVEVEQEASMKIFKLKEGKKDKKIEANIQNNLRDNSNINNKISSSPEESQMKSEFEDKFEYLLDKLNIINQIISFK